MKLFTQRAPGSVAVAVTDRQFHVPPWSESLVQVTISGNLRDSESVLVSAEPTLARHLRSRLLVASCLCSRQADVLSVRVLNLSDEAIELRPCEPLAKVETVQRTDTATEGERRSVDDLETCFPLPDVAAEHRSKLLDLLKRYRSVFAFTREELGHTEALEHRIDTAGHPPIKVPPRRLPHCHRERVEEQLEWLLAKGIIQPSKSPWSAPIVMVRKKNGEYRMCIDYRQLNEITVKDCFPLPRIDDTLDDLAGATIFSTLDLASGFYQLPVAPCDMSKTSFVTP